MRKPALRIWQCMRCLADCFGCCNYFCCSSYCSCHAYHAWHAWNACRAWHAYHAQHTGRSHGNPATMLLKRHAQSGVDSPFETGPFSKKCSGPRRPPLVMQSRFPKKCSGPQQNLSGKTAWVFVQFLRFPWISSYLRPIPENLRNSQKFSAIPDILCVFLRRLLSSPYAQWCGRN